MGLLSVRKSNIIMNEMKLSNYVFLKTPEWTSKYFFDTDDLISSIPNKPTKYFIKVNKKCIAD